MMSKRKLDAEVEVAGQPSTKKAKEGDSVPDVVRSKFRPGLFDDEELKLNIAAYSRSEP